MTAGGGLPTAGRREQDLEEEIRSMTRAAVAGLDPARMANVIVGEEDDILPEASGAPKDALARDREEAQAVAEEDALEAVWEHYADYFGAAERVATTESAADLNRFKALRRKQRGLARAADGAAAGETAEWLVFIGKMLPCAALFANTMDLIGINTLLALGALSLVLYLVGKKLRARRKSLLWEHVFSDPQEASRTVWFSAAAAAAVQLVRRRERDSAEHEAGLRVAEKAWAARDRRSTLFSAEDYAVLNAA